MVLADFFADRHDNALPADHGAEAKSKSDGNLHPQRNEAGGTVNVGLVVLEDRDVGRSEFRLAAFLHDAESLASQIHIVAEVANFVVRHLGEVLEESHLRSD